MLAAEQSINICSAGASRLRVLCKELYENYLPCKKDITLCFTLFSFLVCRVQIRKRMLCLFQVLGFLLQVPMWSELRCHISLSKLYEVISVFTYYPSTCPLFSLIFSTQGHFFSDAQGQHAV